MNALFAAYGALEWKPLLTALLLPPVPLLLLLCVGMGLRLVRRPLSGLSLIVLALFGLWFSHTRVLGDWLEGRWLKAPTALAPDTLPALRRSLAGHKTAVLVLGGGRELYAPEYGDATLTARSLQRLHYGLWLARRLDAPVMVAGGLPLGDRGDHSDRAEAMVAGRIAEQDYGRNIRWQETESRDTRGMASHSLPVLSAQGITDVMLVAQHWHMRRALRDFEEAAAIGGLKLKIIAAPMDTAPSSQRGWLDWLPSAEGCQRVRDCLREMLALMAGA